MSEAFCMISGAQPLRFAMATCYFFDNSALRVLSSDLGEIWGMLHSKPAASICDVNLRCHRAICVAIWTATNARTGHVRPELVRVLAKPNLSWPVMWQPHNSSRSPDPASRSLLLVEVWAPHHNHRPPPCHRQRSAGFERSPNHVGPFGPLQFSIG